MAAPAITGSIVRQAYLECRTGGHHKGYQIYVTMDAAASYTVIVHHGPIGSLKQGKVYLSGASRQQAMDKTSSLKSDKMRRSSKEAYEEIFDQQMSVPAPAPTAPVPRVRTAPKPTTLPRGAVLF